MYSTEHGDGDRGDIGRNLRSVLGTATKEWFFDYMTVYEANQGNYAKTLDEHLNHTHFYKLVANSTLPTRRRLTSSSEDDHAVSLND